jgi:hypothetical protein
VGGELHLSNYTSQPVGRDFGMEKQSRESRNRGENTLQNFVAFFTAMVVLFTAILQREASA